MISCREEFVRPLQAPADRLDTIIDENIPMQDLPQVATNVERDTHDTISVLRGRRIERRWSFIARTVGSR